MPEKERGETLPEQGNDQVEGYWLEGASRPSSNWEGYSLETLSAFFGD